MQFGKRAGFSRFPRDTFPDFFSFEDERQLKEAGKRDHVFDYVGIGLCVGLSPQLIWNIAQQQHNYYRSFEIKKKGGGFRTIESPKVFLKVIQWFIADFVLDDIPVHGAVHSFEVGRSIATNASVHVGRRYVASVDIEDFFGSISAGMVSSHLKKCGFVDLEAVVLSKLCTCRGVLPQGAPTSPVLANSILYDFDSELLELCQKRGLGYTRYADDITVSGDFRELIVSVIHEIRNKLLTYKFVLNEKKTRIASFHGQQRVTGAVVNVTAAPPREYRRRARAIFHQASKTPEDGIKRLPELRGLLGYLKVYPKLREAVEVRRYEQVLRDLEKFDGKTKLNPS